MLHPQIAQINIAIRHDKAIRIKKKKESASSADEECMLAVLSDTDIFLSDSNSFFCKVEITKRATRRKNGHLQLIFLPNPLEVSQKLPTFVLRKKKL